MARKRNGDQAAPAGAGPAAEDAAPLADGSGTTGRQPVQRFRVKNVKAAIWENQARGGTFYSVTYARSYRDEQGDWHDSNSFGEVESYLLQEVASRAARWITERTQAAAPQSASDEIPI